MTFLERAEIAMGAYAAVTDESGTTYFYMQKGTPAEGKAYELVSFDSVVASVSTKNAQSQLN